jgi:hypothetical protein
MGKRSIQSRKGLTHVHLGETRCVRRKICASEIQDVELRGNTCAHMFETVAKTDLSRSAYCATSLYRSFQPHVCLSHNTSTPASTYRSPPSCLEFAFLHHTTTEEITITIHPLTNSRSHPHHLEQLHYQDTHPHPAYHNGLLRSCRCLPRLFLEISPPLRIPNRPIR